MNQHQREQISASIEHFRLPLYHEIPDVGLYLEQTAKYISDYLSPLQDTPVTGSMISNYVKKDLVANPVKKLYSREQLAYLLFIALAKNVLSLDNLSLFIDLQKQTYTTEKAYNYLCDELENVVQYVFGLKDHMDNVGMDSTDEKFMLRGTVITVVHKMYLDKCFEQMAKGQ